jgi:2-polyprenyl-3-methyl-5-hydroxy-6-metoxy-1,4-benzoquinol methylase
VGIKKAVEGTIYDWNIKEKVDLVIFNKVLEHLKFPIPVLKYAKKLLNHGGGVYLELPDGENALENGTAHDREEFFVEHYTIFNRKAIEYLSKVSGYKIVELEQIHEPSDKYTLYAFLVPA